MTHEEIRANHYARLNGYRRSAEYAAFATAVGAEAPRDDLPSLIGDRWAIDGTIYHEFLNLLPPLGWHGNTFFMREFSFGDVTAKFTRVGDEFYCEFARFPGRRAA